MTMEIVGKNVVFFSYWTYMTMEIFSIDVVFFSYWTYMTMEILRKKWIFTCNLKTLLCLHFGGSENIISLAC